MRTLTPLEIREYEKTYSFLNHYIGATYYLPNCESMHDILINNKPLPEDIKMYINTEHNGKLWNIHMTFNGSSDEHKRNSMQKLISYCNKNRVQPSKLRVIGIEEFRIKEKIEIESISFEY